MTPQEHYFMMVMTARQNAKFNILYEALKAGGIIQADDLEAYRQYVVSEKPQELGDWLAVAWGHINPLLQVLG